MSIAIVFPGQGSQFPEMVDPWLDHPASAAVVRQASELLGSDLAAAVKAPGALERTDTTQLAVFTCDLAAWAVLQAEGVQPVAMAGHSLGEFAALVAAGATSFERAFAAVKARADAMQRACGDREGTMLAVIGVSADEAASIAKEAAQGDDLVVANENSPQQTVLSGSVAAIERAQAVAKERKASAVRIAVAGAFHSPLMASALGPIAAAVTQMDLQSPGVPIVENSSAEATTDPAVLKDLLSRHVVSPVRWVASVEAMTAMGATTFVEAGPGKVLTGMIKRCAPGAEAVTVGNPDDAVALADRLAGEGTR